MSTPLKIARLADKRKPTQSEIAIVSGIDPSHYSRIEAGEVTPSPAVAERIAAALLYTISEIQILYPERFTTAQEPA